MFDIGAGVGGETLLFSGLVGPAGRVVAVEANPAMFGCLEESVRLTGLDNSTCLQVAIFDRPGEMTISDDSNLIANHLIPDDSGGVRVPATTLDALARGQGIERLALLKMNIEGAERAALEAAGELLARTDRAVIACHDFLADPDDPDDPMRTKRAVCEILERAGFAVATRPDHPLVWVRDFVYARSTSGQPPALTRPARVS